MYIDIKETMWSRIKIPDQFREKVIAAIKSGEITNFKDLKHTIPDFNWEDYYSMLLETADFLPLNENYGFPTMELFDDEDKRVWNNRDNEYNDDGEER